MVRYNKAPVVEAVIDVQMLIDPPPSQEQIESFGRSLKAELPLAHRVQRVQFAVSSAPVSAQVAPPLPMGLRLSNEQNSGALVLRPNGLVWSQFPQYTDWDAFCGQALRFLDCYRAEFKPKACSRIATRFINAFTVPDGIELAQYINVLPSFPDELSDTVNGYHLQLAIALPDVHPACMAVINTGLQGTNVQGEIKLLLDIDVAIAGEFAPDQAEVTSWLNKLRVAKNKVFELCITDLTRELIK